MRRAVRIRQAARVWARLLYPVGLVLLAACRPDGSGSPARPLETGTVIAVIGPDRTDARFQGILGGARRYARQLPGLTCLTLAPTDPSVETLVATVDDALRRQPEAVCLYVTDPRRARPAMERLTRAGVMLVTIGAPFSDVPTSRHVGIRDADGAELLARNLLATLPAAVGAFARARSQRSYVLLHASGRDQAASECYARFRAFVPGPPNLTLLEEVNLWQTQRSMTDVLADVLGRYRTAELVVSLDPEPWLTREPRLQLPPANRLATLAAPPRMWQRLQAGEASVLVGVLDGELGYVAVELAVQGLMRVPEAPLQRWIGVEVVTAANLADFARRYAAAADVKIEELWPPAAQSAPATAPADGRGG